MTFLAFSRTEWYPPMGRAYQPSNNLITTHMDDGKEKCDGICNQTSVPPIQCSQCSRTQRIEPWGIGILVYPSACRGARVQAGTYHGDTQHLSVLLGRLRSPDV